MPSLPFVFLRNILTSVELGSNSGKFFLWEYNFPYSTFSIYWSFCSDCSLPFSISSIFISSSFLGILLNLSLISRIRFYSFFSRILSSCSLTYPSLYLLSFIDLKELFSLCFKTYLHSIFLLSSNCTLLNAPLAVLLIDSIIINSFFT